MFWKKPKPDLRPEWMIVGLGNPGGEYRGTRHNVGFDVLEHLAERNRIKLDRSKHRARIGLGLIRDVPVVLVKPLTFMNLSGQAVAPLARDYALEPERILVIADEMDLPLGKIRLREQGSAGGHNGHKSLIQYLHTQNYPRLRIGIGRGSDSIDHVLSGFDQRDRDIVDEAIVEAAKVCEEMVAGGYAPALKLVDAFNQGPEA